MLGHIGYTFKNDLENTQNTYPIFDMHNSKHTHLKKRRLTELTSKHLQITTFQDKYK